MLGFLAERNQKRKFLIPIYIYMFFFFKYFVRTQIILLKIFFSDTGDL